MRTACPRPAQFPHFPPFPPTVLWLLSVRAASVLSSFLSSLVAFRFFFLLALQKDQPGTNAMHRLSGTGLAALLMLGLASLAAAQFGSTTLGTSSKFGPCCGCCRCGCDCVSVQLKCCEVACTFANITEPTIAFASCSLPTHPPATQSVPPVMALERSLFLFGAWSCRHLWDKKLAAFSLV